MHLHLIKSAAVITMVISSTVYMVQMLLPSVILHPLAHESNTQLRNVLGRLPIGGVSSSVLTFIHIAIHGMKFSGHLLYSKSQNLKGLDS